MFKNKRFFSISAVILSLILAISYTLIQNNELKRDLKKEKQQSQMLEAEKDYKQMISFYKQKSQGGKPKASGYEMMVESKKLAKQFTKESDGRFKEEWGHFLVRESMKKGIDPYIVYELLRVETGNQFDPKAVGPETKYGRAYGMAQFMENTAPWISKMAGLEYKNKEQLFDPLYSIQLAIVYLDYLYSKYDNWDKALTAYHRGIYGMEKYIQEKGHAKSWYAEEIQQKAKEQELLAVTN
ncbi:lytic transglycosylase domain-containing protein [Alkalihalobacillus sp. TS-13]|uniref:lytic transglycosylase domain-containing protein n=1 Tax=Alkalihalobacillus sp. TS-13 TaxID=2842455 RepID=UPI001C88D42E|nr:transglycosylase SLT domain-containing protein [Alkalihalobacillus sp. TS-13]